jgi:KaiC/GvpD/RAD55 family RecA-like ATPase
MDVRKFLIEERGLTPETLDAFNVEFDGDTASFPYPGGKKHRRHDDDGKRHFFADKGMQVGLFCAYQPPEVHQTAFIVEGETDTMRLYQELEGVAAVFGISGLNGWREEFAQAFEQSEDIWLILDNDQDSQAIGAGEETFRQVRKDLGRRVRRLHLPADVKDVCEFFDRYDLDALRLIAESVPTAGFHYKALDLSSPAPAPRWLVEELIGRGDVVLQTGEPGVGKSWLSMSLAIAVADEGDTWLGRSISTHGRVLYIDEENGEEIVRQRLEKLGLDLDATENLRYVHQQGVRLDRYPERILDEAVAFDPVLIVLDSLTRFHTQDENSAGAMAALFNDAINPLARETGATVLLLHHVNKGDSTSGFGRARGSGDITASIDTGLDVREGGSGRINVYHFKSRRRSSGDIFQAEIVDTPEGGVAILNHRNKVF